MQSNIRQVYRQIVNYHFSNCQIANENQIFGGRVNNIFKLKTEMNTYTIKIQNILDEICQQAIGNEYYLLKDNEDLSAVMPRVYYLDGIGSRFGFKYIILEYVEGKTIENESKEIFYSAGKVLAQIHSNNSKYLGRIQDRIIIRSQKEIAEYYVTYFSSTLRALEKIDSRLAEMVKKYIKNRFSMNYYKEQSVVLLHNDVHPKNIIVSNKNIKFIDWDCSKYGHGELDFVKFRHLSRTVTDQECVANFWRGYETKHSNIITPNFKCHEIIWLSKMIVFDSYNPTKAYDYFPEKSYYKNEIIKIIQEGKLNERINSKCYQ